MLKKFTLIFIFSTITNTVWAARPFVTDDARLTTAGSCQIESWTGYTATAPKFGRYQPAIPPEISR